MKSWGDKWLSTYVRTNLFYRFTKLISKCEYLLENLDKLLQKYLWKSSFKFTQKIGEKYFG